MMDDKRSQFCVMNDIVNDRKGHSIVNDSFAHKSDGLLVTIVNSVSTWLGKMRVHLENSDLLFICLWPISAHNVHACKIFYTCNSNDSCVYV